ncbi:hypothetical protein DFP72DRAFT_1075786 [Ephemerocybe angulata]|uniref:F-box domain-containing protein n=1 Tax=Ephemerocybe angulata TaxID=980116 RepID=A0A8H6HHN3_9AGAR|nr:hypothetical protein DFP72DRAFT_1075786 [Tulosesus angulatus]
MGKRKNDTTEAPTKGKKKKLCPERSEERIVSTKKPTTRKRVSETTVPGRSKSKAMTRRVWREPSVDSDEGRFDPYFSDDPQSYEGSPPPEPANIKDLPVELLWEIFDYVLLQAYQRRTKAGDVGTSGPFSPNSARNILKRVCQRWAWHLDDCTDKEKIKGCFSKDADTSSRRMPPRKANPSEKDKLARKAIRKQIERAEEECDRLAENLVTLRIVEPSEKLSHWDSDWQPCVLPPGRYPALRHVELIITEQLCSFALPYRQLTHLTLVTLEGDDVVLGILKGCRKLESLTITRPTGKDADLESTAAPIVLSNLTMLAIELLDQNTGRYFLDRIQVPKLNSLKVDSECLGSYERCAPVLQGLFERSQCAPRDLHLNFVDSEIKGPVATKLAELLAFTSESLEHLTLRARLVDETWLKDFLPPRLQTLALVSFSIPRVLDDYNDYVDEEDGPTLKFFIQALHWTKEWMTGPSPADKANRRITFLAGPPSISQVYYGDTNKGHYQSDDLPPQKIADAIQGLKATGVQAEMTWLFRDFNWKALR